MTIDDLEKIAQAVAFETTQQQTPEMINSLIFLLNHGRTAKQIEKSLIERFGEGTVTNTLILTARYIERTRPD